MEFPLRRPAAARRSLFRAEGSLCRAGDCIDRAARAWRLRTLSTVRRTPAPPTGRRRSPPTEGGGCGGGGGGRGGAAAQSTGVAAVGVPLPCAAVELGGGAAAAAAAPAAVTAVARARRRRLPVRRVPPSRTRPTSRDKTRRRRCCRCRCRRFRHCRRAREGHPPRPTGIRLLTAAVGARQRVQRAKRHAQGVPLGARQRVGNGPAVPPPRFDVHSPASQRNVPTNRGRRLKADLTHGMRARTGPPSTALSAPPDIAGAAG